MPSIIGDTSPGNALETMTATGMPTSSLQATKLIANGLRYWVSHSPAPEFLISDLTGYGATIFGIDA